MANSGNVTFVVELNGTDENPYHRFGVTQNPFPLGDAEYDAAYRIVQSLGGDPIPDIDYIKRKLQGFSQEFVDLCCRKFEKGKMVRFGVSF